MYFVVANLAEIDPMYQYSLKYFTQVQWEIVEAKDVNFNCTIEVYAIEVTSLLLLFPQGHHFRK